MNKVIAVLGIIVLLTLAMLFFCLGFFTGSTASPNAISGAISEEIRKISGGAAGDNGESAGGADGKMSKEAVDQMLSGVGDIKSAKISDKIMGILAAAGYKVENFSEMVKSKAQSFAKSSFGSKNGGNQITVDSLLREMAISHDPQDDCSETKTLAEINKLKAKPATDQGLYGKKIVFIGYFKNSVSLQIQKLLATKGYKTHVEMSKDGHDSFVFCGPFKKDESAAALLKWLKMHDFSEARIISITREAIEETLYDAMNDEGDELPRNSETIAPAATTASTSAVAPAAVGATGVPATAAAAPVRPAVAVAPARPGVVGGPAAAVARPGVAGAPINPAVGVAGNMPALNQTLNRAVNPAAPLPVGRVVAATVPAAVAPQVPGAQINLPRM